MSAAEKVSSPEAEQTVSQEEKVDRAPSSQTELSRKKAELKDIISTYNQPDLRFSYFRSRRDPRIYITAVSILNRELKLLTVAFSFTSPKDHFCRWEGKYECFKKLMQNNIEHVVIVPWLEDGLLTVYYAYNCIKNEDRPIRLLNTKFNDLVFIKKPRALLVH